MRDIERNIVQSALARNPFFTFASLKRYFPHLASMRDFIASEDYLGGLEITFQGNVYGLDENQPKNSRHVRLAESNRSRNAPADHRLRRHARFQARLGA